MAKDVSVDLAALRSSLYYKGKLGTFFGGEEKGESPNRYDKLRAKLGDLSTQGSEDEDVVSLSWRQRRTASRAVGFVLKRPGLIKNEVAYREFQAQGIMESLEGGRTQSTAEVIEAAREHVSQLCVAAEAIQQVL
jgi:hypothetical protein